MVKSSQESSLLTASSLQSKLTPKELHPRKGKLGEATGSDRPAVLSEKTEKHSKAAIWSQRYQSKIPQNADANVRIQTKGI
jgi:hypothetical protein